jgi:uncharacterized protein YxjI
MDAEGNVVYDVQSEFFTLAAKLHLYDSNGQEQYFIKKKLTFLLAEYEIYNNSNYLCATVSQEFAFFKSKLNVNSSFGNFEINGDFMSMDYDILRNGQYYGSVHKKWFSWGDSYELDIPSPEDAGFVSALVIAIDNCLHNENRNN